MSKQLSVDVLTDIETEVPQKIAFNYDALKKELAATLKKYKGVVVTQETMPDAKSTRADLNRFKKSLNDTRIAIGKAWNRPYDAFKAQVDELIAMVDEPASEIDVQVKAFEDAEREEKRDNITVFYEQNIKDLKDVLPLERIWDDKWLNKGTTLVAATNQLFERIESVRKEIETINKMEISHKDYLLNAYLRTLNIGAALDARRIYEDEQKAVQRMQEPVATTPPPATRPQEQPFPPEVTAPPVPIPETPRDLELRFYCTTKAFRQSLKALALQHNIRYEGGILNGNQQ